MREIPEKSGFLDHKLMSKPIIELWWQVNLFHHGKTWFL